MFAFSFAKVRHFQFTTLQSTGLGHRLVTPELRPALSPRNGSTAFPSLAYENERPKAVSLHSRQWLVRDGVLLHVARNGTDSAGWTDESERPVAFSLHQIGERLVLGVRRTIPDICRADH